MPNDRQAENVDVKELEARVLLAELKAREVEAEIRLITAIAKRRDLKSTKRAHKKQRTEQGKGKSKARARAEE